jgi:hypothetical protein
VCLVCRCSLRKVVVGRTRISVFFILCISLRSLPCIVANVCFVVAERDSFVFSDEQVAVLGCTRDKAVLVREPEAGEYNPPKLVPTARERKDKEKMAPRRIKIRRKREEVPVVPTTQPSPVKGEQAVEPPSPPPRFEKEQILPETDICSESVQILSPEEGRSAQKRKRGAEESAGFTELDQFLRSPPREVGEGSVPAGGPFEHTSSFTPVFEELRAVSVTEEMKRYLKPRCFSQEESGQYVPEIEVGVNESAVTARAMDGSTLGMRALRALNLPGDGCPDELIAPFSDADNALLLVSVLLSIFAMICLVMCMAGLSGT